MKKYLFYILKITISCFFIYLFFNQFDKYEIFNIFKKVKFLWLFLGLLISFFCWLINSYKWKLILNDFKIKTKLIKLFNLNLISIFYSSILPGGQLTGETIKCYKLIKNEAEKIKLTFSIILDRITGFVGMILLASVGIIFSKTKIENLSSICYLIIFVCFLSFLFIAIVLSNKTYAFLDNLIRKIKKNKIKNFFLNIFHSFLIYKNTPNKLIIVILYSLIFQFLNSLSLYFVSISLNININFLDILWINGLVSILLIIPITILGIGIREGSFIFFLNLININNTEALSLSLSITIVYLIIGLLGGLIEFSKIIKNKE